MWISVEERLPDLNTDVLVVDQKKIVIAALIYRELCCPTWIMHRIDDDWHEIDPKYWMPLPPIPAEESFE